MSRNFREGQYWCKSKGKHLRIPADARHAIHPGLPTGGIMYYPWRGVPFKASQGLIWKNGRYV